MKRNFLLVLFIHVILISSCKKDEVKYTLGDLIQAGQKNGLGIEYTDLEPDINCTIVDPWQKTDTTINLDLNSDGIHDFSLFRTMCDPSMLGGDCEDVTIIPLMDNEICVDFGTNWLDTLSNHDSIKITNNWTHNEALLYSYYWVLGGVSSTEGFWQHVKDENRNFIGFKILKNEKSYFGWIGMKSDSTFRSYDFYLTDYAILKEYSE
jgi:hypothetical protein